MRRRELLFGAGTWAAWGTMAGCRPQPTMGPDAAVPPPCDERLPEVDARWSALAGFCDGIAAPDDAERRSHRTRMTEALAAAGQRALVVEPGPTMQFLAGVRWGRSERPFLLVLPREGEAFWVVPAFEELRAREQLGDADVSAWQEHESPYEIVAKRLGGASDPVAVEPQMRGFIVEGLRQAMGATAVVDGAAVVHGVRMRKQPAELARLRRANEATKAALRLVASEVGGGIRQSELAELIRAAQNEAGLGDVWVLALIGPNAAFPHGTAEDRALTEGDVVLVDTGGSLHGYRSDITRTWVYGTPSDEVRTAWATVAEAQRRALEKIGPGVQCGEVDAQARAVIEAAGFGTGYERFTHRLGHGIGLEVHEPPYLVQASTQVLEPGMTMSNEPGIYVPGQFGIRIEDIVAVTETGAEVFGPMVESIDQPFGAQP
ncbi:MAG: Xaa-Pro peptidase family protein [Myxococcota bacterium]